jgi:hypothetical protein
MKHAGNISGGKPHYRKYGVDGGITINAGEPVVTGEAVADNGGVTVATTIAAVGFMGCAEADATSTDAQATSGSNVQEVSCCINPDAIWRCKLSGDAAEDVDLLLLTSAAAVSAGTTVTGLVDENICWCYEGNNVGAGFRKATDTDTVVVAFPNAIAAGDTWCYAPLGVGTRTQYPQLTTNLTQIDIDDGTVDSDNANFIAIDFELGDVSNEGRSNSYALLVSVDHAFGPNPV